MFRGFISLTIIGLFGSILSITSLYRCLWCFNTARSAISTFDVIGILRRFSSLTDTDPSSAVCHSFHFLVALLCVFVWGLSVILVLFGLGGGLNAPLRLAKSNNIQLPLLVPTTMYDYIHTK